MSLTGPMRVALCAAVDADALSPRIPKETNYNTVMALWRRRLIDDGDCITPVGRRELQEDLSRRRRMPASAAP